MSRFTRYPLCIALGLFILLFLYLFFWPVAVDPKVWSAPEAPEYVGQYRVNSDLAEFEALSLAGQRGPEGVAVSEGYVYAATEAGWIVRWSLGALAEGDTEGQLWANTQGRPLGLALGPDGDLWVADAFRGILRVDASGTVHSVLETFDGKPLLYANDLTFAANGYLYFTDSTTRFSAKAYGSTYQASLVDLMEHGDTGRVFEFDPDSGQVRQLFDGLSFANGIAADPQGRFILVNETAEYRVWKYWLSGEKVGQREVLVDNLPGFPDNLYVGGAGPNGDVRYWLGFTSPRLPLVDTLADKPMIRKIVQRLPSFVRPKAKHYGHVLAITGDGAIVKNLQDPNAGYPLTTGVAETDKHLYISSLVAPVLARLEKVPLGL